MKCVISIVLVVSLFGACKNIKMQDPKFDVFWQLQQNLVNEKGESKSLLTLTNNSTIDIPVKGWSLYFNSIATYKADEKSGVEVVPVNGDLRVIKPIKNFAGLQHGESIEFTLFANSSALNISDAPCGFYLVFDNDLSKGIACNLAVGEFPLLNLKRQFDEELPVYTPEVAYAENDSLKLLKKGDFCPIIPTPKEIKLGTNPLLLKNVINISFDEAFINEAYMLKQKLTGLFSGEILLNQSLEKQITIVKANNFESKPEAYKLSISEKDILIEAGSAAGAFYGVQSLLALISIENWKTPSNILVINSAVIYDEPRFEYRGMFMDVARNFQPKENVMKLLDVMALYKLNKFHFHICDDEGWRVEINDLPELTEFGAYRGYSENESKYLYPSFGSGPIADPSLSHGCGFYSRADFIEILKYATQRHIEVIPEIDMPGHARAAIRSMQVRYHKYMELNDTEKANEYLLNDWQDESEYRSVQGWNDNVIDVGMNSTYNFIEKVTNEMVLLFKEANAPLTCIHTGGDEVPHGVWSKSPSCMLLIKELSNGENVNDLSQYFVKRFSDILNKHGLVAAGWEEIGLKHGDKVEPNVSFVGKNLRPYVWNNMWNSGAEDIGYKLANAGYPIVFAHVTNLYFDLAYNKNPNEPGYYWGNFIDTRKPWEYTPLDITKCAEYDCFGHRISREKLLQNMECLNEKGKGNVLGMQGLLWSENNLGLERMEYLILPKLLGLAERAWAQQPEWAEIEDNIKRNELRELAWLNFVNTLGQFDLPRLDFYNGGMGYRIPTPGAKKVDGILYANIGFPGLEIRYTIDNSEPTKESTLYTEPIQVSGIAKLKTFNSMGRASRTIEIQ